MVVPLCYAENNKEQIISILRDKITEGFTEAVEEAFNCVMIVIPDDIDNYIYISNAYERIRDDKSILKEGVIILKQFKNDKIHINTIKEKILLLLRQKTNVKKVIFAVNSNIRYDYLQKVIDEYEVSLADIEQKETEVLSVKYEFLESFRFIK